MEALAVAYTLCFALFTLLTLGWLIHLVSNKNEATKMHQMLILIPLSAWLSFLFGMIGAYSGSFAYQSTAAYALWATLTQIFAIVNQGAMFYALAHMASGYCLLPNGMVAGRSANIFGWFLAGIVLQCLALGFARYSSWFSLGLLVVYICQMVYLIKWSRQTVEIARENPNANLLNGTWACSYPQRVHVAEGSRKATLFYILTVVIMVILTAVFTVMVTVWLVNALANVDSSTTYSAYDWSGFVAWTVGLLVTATILNAALFIYIASVWRMGSTEKYALLPQHGYPSAPAYATTGGDYAPVYVAAPAAAYGTMQPTAVGYAPAPQGSYTVNP